MLRSLLWLSLLGCLFACTGSEPKPSSVASAEPLSSPFAAGAFTLSGVTLMDGTKTNVAVEGRRISEIGPKVALGEQLDGSGLTLLPGFIDAHVHLGFFSPKEVLRGGLTTVRDLGWDPAVSLGWVRSSADPTWGPKVLAVGPMLTVSGGYPFDSGWAPQAAAVVGSPEVVESLAAEGVRFLKVTLEPAAGPTLSASQLTAVVESAHQHGMKVCAHVSGLDELEKALGAGVDELSHMLFDSASIPDATLKRMVEAKVVVVPTLRVNPSPQRLSNLGRFARAGGRVVYGTDLGNGGGPGISVEELHLMVKAGLTPAQAIAAGTENAADWLGLDGRGRVREGAVADLLLVRGNPLADFEVLARPALVIREGQRMDAP